MYVLVNAIHENIHYAYVLMGLALLWRKAPGVIPLVLFGVVLIGVSEWMYLQSDTSYFQTEEYETLTPVQWLRFFAALSWSLASLIGWLGRSSNPNPDFQQNSESLVPAVPINPEHCAARAEQERERIIQLFENSGREFDIPVHVLSSYAHEPNPKIRVEVSNRPDLEPDLVHLACATISIALHPFRKFELLYTVVVNTGAKTKEWLNVTELRDEEIAAILGILTDVLSLRKFRPARTRIWPWELWLPKNRYVALSNSRSPPFHRVLAGIFPPLLLLLPKIPVHLLRTGQPPNEPRRLTRIDSWQARVERVGTGCETLRDNVVMQLNSKLPAEAHTEFELVKYWSSTGKVEREQLVVSLRRAIAFVHIYRYGEDLFVGWDSHVNAGAWTEIQIDEGFSRQHKLPLKLLSVKPTLHRTNEYDVLDASFLSESVHAVLARAVKMLIKEHEVDQEIDFTIVRESRRTSTEASQAGDSQQKKRFLRAG